MPCLSRRSSLCTIAWTVNATDHASRSHAGLCYPGEVKSVCQDIRNFPVVSYKCMGKPKLAALSVKMPEILKAGVVLLSKTLANDAGVGLVPVSLVYGSVSPSSVPGSCPAPESGSLPTSNPLCFQRCEMSQRVLFHEACLWHHVLWDASEFPSQPLLCRPLALADFLWLHTHGSLPCANSRVPAVGIPLRPCSHGSRPRPVMFLPELGQQNGPTSGCRICYLCERPSETVGLPRAETAWPIGWGRSWFWW